MQINEKMMQGLKKAIIQAVAESEREAIEDGRGTGNDVLHYYAVSPVIFNLIKKIADEKEDSKLLKLISNIEKNRGNRYYKIKNTMRDAIAEFLLLRYGNQRTVFAAAFGTTEEEMFGPAPKGSQETTIDDIKAKQLRKEKEKRELLKKKEEAAKKYEDENAKAAMLAEFLGLPKLSGTQTQVAWAESIRMKCLARASASEIEKIKLSKNAKKAKWWIEEKPTNIYCALLLLGYEQ